MSTELGLDLTQTLATFLARYGTLLQPKRDRSPYSDAQSGRRELANRADLLDDFVIAYMARAEFDRYGEGAPDMVASIGTRYTDTETGDLYVNRTGLVDGWEVVGASGAVGDLDAIAANTVVGNPTGSSAAPTTFACTAAGRALLDDADAAAQRTTLGLVTIASSGSASDLSAGTLPAARFNDTAHGDRAGGTLHAVVVAAGTAGFMSGADKTKLDGLQADGSGAYPAIIADVDYTAEANDTPTLGEVIVYGGLSHTWQLNTGGTQLSQADAVNGTGLVLRYKTSGAGALDISDSNDTAGGVYFELGSLPNYSPAHRYLFLWHFTPAAGAAWDSTDSIRFFAKVVAGATGSRYEGLTGYGRGCAVIQNSLASVQPIYAANNGATQGASRSEITPVAGGTAGAPVAYNVAGIRIDEGGDALSIFAGNYNGGWPTIASLISIGKTASSDGGNGGYSHLRVPVARIGVYLAGPAGAASPHGCDIHRLRVYDLGL